MRTRLKFIVPGLLVVACVGWLWLRSHEAAVTSQPSAAASSAASHTASSAATTKAAIVAKVAKLSASTTNRLAYRLSNTTRKIGDLEHDRRAVLLENAFIDTSKQVDLKIPSQLQAKGDPGAYIVQARNPINAAFQNLILQTGGKIVSYIPNNAYLAQMSAGEAAALQGNPAVQAVLPYEPYYKVQSTLLGLAIDQEALPPGMFLTLGLYGSTANATLAQIQQLGGKILSQDRSPFGSIVRIAPPTDWVAIADLPGVQLVEPAHLKKSANDLSRVALGVSVDTLTNADYLNLGGSNVLVDINDSGVDALHPDFSLTGTAAAGASGGSRVTGDFPSSLLDTDGHGTHVAGIIAGNGSESSTLTNVPAGSVTNADFRGKAPLATLFAVNFQDADSYLQEEAARTNALISNNSWAIDGDNEYDLAAASYDAAVRDALPQVTGPQPVLFVFAAGNDGAGASDGTGGNADSIQSPGTAKNVITVGALEQLRNITNVVTALDGTSNAVWQPETDSAFEAADYSARGNVGVQTEGTFGRFKPDVVAPGSFVVSTRSEQWDMDAYYNPTNYHSQTFLGEEVTSNSYTFKTLFVPQNAVGVFIETYPNVASPVPFPTNMPIYVSALGFPVPTNSGTYDFVTSNDTVRIPPDQGGLVGDITTIQDGGLLYAVGDPTNIPVIYNLFEESITTNDNGNELTVLSNLNNTIGPWYRYESGTSMAAGSVSGVLALMQDYFINTLHTNPSPALMKAMLINGARTTGGYQYGVTNDPNIEGWGQVQLPNSIPQALTNTAAIATNTPMFFVDQSPTNYLKTGDQRTYLVTVPTFAAQAQMLRVTLAWTDPPGNPAAAIKLVNDLELVVTNLSNGSVYYANNFGFAGPPTVSVPSSTNDTPIFDPINNVKQIAIPPLLGTNYSVTVIGAAVNVNAVTLEQTNIVQDFALVISSGDGSNTNGITVTAATPAPVPALVPLVTFLPSTNGIYFNQIAGASAPWLNTNDLSLGGNPAYAPNSVFHIGQTNQWHFYVITNTFAETNSAFTNAAFIIFLPETLSIPREGVFAGNNANSTRPEADMELLVSSTGPSGADANAAAITNLDPGVISNCLYQVNGDASSYSRGGTEFVTFSNSVGGQIYYLAVQSQDQTAGEYALVPIFTDQPFSQLGTNGDQYVTGLNVPAAIPDGDNVHPGSAYVIGLALSPMDIRRVIVTNTFSHQNFGDLLGSVSHDGDFAILNNHDGYGPITPAFPLVYDDSGQGDITAFPTNSDGPGTLKNFVGQEGAGPWILTEVDDSFTQTGSVSSFNVAIEPHHPLTKQPFEVVSVPAGTWFYDFVDVPVGYTNLLVVATNLPPTSVPPIELFVKQGSEPGFGDTNYMTLLTNSPLGPYPANYVGNQISVGPPLQPGRYFVGLFNPDTVEHDVLLGAILSFNAAAISTVDYASAGPQPLLDDAVTFSSIAVTNPDTIQEFKVGLRVDHPRISDLVFHMIDPKGNRYLLMENRGGQSTNGCGLTVVTTNFFTVAANGGSAGNTNSFNVGQTSGSFPISYDFFTLPDEMTVYYGTNLDAADLIYDSGLVPGANNILVKYPPATATVPSTFLTIVMNQFGNEDGTNDQWVYTAGGVLTNYYYLTFTEDTNFTTTPIKFAPPPFVPFVQSITNISGSNNPSFSTFDAVTPGDFASSSTVDGWNVTSNEVSVANDPSNAVSGQFLALGSGSIVRNLTTQPGSTYTVSYAYRGPGILGMWRGENNGNDSINGNNGAPVNVNYTSGEVNNAFSMNGSTLNMVDLPIYELTNTLTVEGWVNPSGSGYIIFWRGDNRPGYDPYALSMDGGANITFQISDVNDIGASVTSPIAINQWSHVAGVFDSFSGTLKLYINGVLANQTSTSLIPMGPLIPANSPAVSLGSLGGTESGGFAYQGGIDEMSLYNRALSGSEIQAIYNAGSAGKFDSGQSFPQNLAKARAVLNGAPTVFFGMNTNWQTNTVTFVATSNNTALEFDGLEPGMLVDSFNLIGPPLTNATMLISNLYYQAEQSLDPIVGTAANGTGHPGDTGFWTLEVLDNRAGATNASLVSWQLEFQFANTNIAGGPTAFTNGPTSGTVGAGGIVWFLINTPTNADLATNSLLFGSQPLNLIWSTNQPPTYTNTTDVLLLGNSTAGSAVIGTNPVTSLTPPAFFTPGSFYYLGVQNSNATPANFTIDVTFHFIPSAPSVITEPATNITYISATLEASVNANGLPTGVYFEYGTTTNYGLFSTTTVLSANLNAFQPVGIPVASLLPGTLYHFQAIGTNGFGTNFGGDLTFITPVNPPAYAYTMPGTLLNGNSAQLNGMATPNGSDTLAWFEWGQNISYGSITPAVDVGTNFNVVYVTNEITGLITNQPYHYRLVVSNTLGITHGFDQVFAQANIVAWGSDSHGQTIPIPTGLTNLVVGLGAGNDFSYALNYNGTVTGWGDNSFGQTNVPSGLVNAVQVRGGEFNGVALRSDGGVTAWGGDNFSQTNVPLNLTNAVAIASGTFHCLALKSDGNVVAWGTSFFNDTNIPVGLSNVVEVAGGFFHSVALKNDGTVVAWGSDANGQTNVPAGLNTVVAVAAGDNFNLALKFNGTVVAWGDGQNGDTSVPASLTNVVAIAAGGSHALALRSDGTVVAWGDNSSFETIPLPTGLTNVVAIISGESHNLALSAVYGLNQTNNAPFWTNGVNGTTVSMNEQTTLLFTNAAIDTNVPAQVLNYQLLNAPSWASVDFRGIITFSPGEADGPSTNVITTVVTDNGRPPLSATNTFILVVNEVNTAPFFPTNAPKDYIVLRPGIFTVTDAAHDNDIPVNPLTYALTGPAGATINPSTAVITWSTAAAPIGSVNYFTNVVTDTNQYALFNQSLSATNVFTVTVVGTQTGPFWPTNIPDQIITVPTNLTLVVTALDLDVPAPHLSYSLANAPAGMTISTVGTNGVINWSPTPAQSPGVYSNILAIVSDNVLPTPKTATNAPFTIFVTTNGIVSNPPSASTNIFISSIVETNINGTNGFLLTWFAPSNDLFKVQWENTLVPSGWQEFSNIVSYNVGAFTSPTNTQFNYFDNGTQSSGFSTNRFYRLRLLGAGASLTLPVQTNYVVTVPGTLVVTNFATDSNVGAVLTYTLITSPANNATITNGIITWNTTLASTNSVYQFTTIVTDNSTPQLRATNVFNVLVGPFGLITSVSVATNKVTLQWLAPTNDTFQMRWTTNLAAPISWTIFPGIITSTTGTFSFVDTNTLPVMKFYQFILLP